jgi:hypothetical protein
MKERENDLAMECSQWETPQIEVVDVSCGTLGGANAGEDGLEQS